MSSDRAPRQMTGRFSLSAIKVNDLNEEVAFDVYPLETI